MFKPLEQSVCDGCREIINNKAEGWIEWVSKDGMFEGFRIIHRAERLRRLRKAVAANYLNHVGLMDQHLENFLQGGTVHLLSFLDTGPHHEPLYNGPRVANMREFVEVFRRLAIPGYEEARLYWNTAEEDGYFNGMNEIEIYLPETLMRLIAAYAPK